MLFFFSNAIYKYWQSHHQLVVNHCIIQLAEDKLMALLFNTIHQTQLSLPEQLTIISAKEKKIYKFSWNLEKVFHLNQYMQCKYKLARFTEKMDITQ